MTESCASSFFPLLPCGGGQGGGKLPSNRIHITLTAFGGEGVVLSNDHQQQGKHGDEGHIPAIADEAGAAAKIAEFGDNASAIDIDQRPKAVP